MRKATFVATFLGLGSLSAGVSAVPQKLSGTDEVTDLLVDSTGVLAQCLINNVPLSPSIINYVGTGSSGFLERGSDLGEGAMIDNSGQHVAPMSRFLANTNHETDGTYTICNPTNVSGLTPATAEGINFGLEALSIVAASTAGGSSTCNGSTADCSTSTDPNKGLAINIVVHDVEKIVPGPNMALETIRSGTDILVGGTQNNGTTIKPGLERILAAGPGQHVQSTPSGDDVVLPEVTYTFTDWRDVLMVVYGGYDRISNSKQCASAIRFATVDTYANIFQTGCSTSATQTPGTTATNGNGCRPKTCSGSGTTCSTIGDGPAELRHAFRRDDDRSETFVALLGLPVRPTIPGQHSILDVTSPDCFNPFCNAFTGTFPPEDLRTDNVISDDQGTQFASKGGAYDWDYQDYDPIRRRCMDTDDVCDRRGTLGVVLPIISTDFLTKPQAFALTSSGGTVIQGTSAAGMLGTSQAATIPVYHACSGTTSKVDGRCPNGVTQQTGCQWPNTGDATTPSPLGTSYNNYTSNFNGKDNAPTESPFNDVVYAGWRVHAADGRAYNKFVHDLGAAPTLLLRDKKIIGTQARGITGAFYRLHTAVEGLGPAQELPDTGGTQRCTTQSASAQIGCLVANDPCSIGEAARSTVSGATALKVNQLDPTDACAQLALTSPSTAYPLTARLFLNSVAGFESPSLTNGELALAQCISNPSLMRSILTGHDLVPLGPSGSDTPLCIDYNEQSAAQCNLPGPATDACAGNQSIPLVTGCNGCASIPGSTGLTLP
jgi:hypothetical protein